MVTQGNSNLATGLISNYNFIFLKYKIKDICKNKNKNHCFILFCRYFLWFLYELKLPVTRYLHFTYFGSLKKSSVDLFFIFWLLKSMFYMPKQDIEEIMPVGKHAIFKVFRRFAHRNRDLHPFILFPKLKKPGVVTL